MKKILTNTYLIYNIILNASHYFMKVKMYTPNANKSIVRYIKIVLNSLYSYKKLII